MTQRAAYSTTYSTSSVRDSPGDKGHLPPLGLTALTSESSPWGEPLKHRKHDVMDHEGSYRQSSRSVVRRLLWLFMTFRHTILWLFVISFDMLYYDFLWFFWRTMLWLFSTYYTMTCYTMTLFNILTFYDFYRHAMP